MFRGGFYVVYWLFLGENMLKNEFSTQKTLIGLLYCCLHIFFKKLLIGNYFFNIKPCFYQLFR